MPEDIPDKPSAYYRDKGWRSMHDFLRGFPEKKPHEQRKKGKNDAQIIKECIKVEKTDLYVKILVEHTSWLRPHEPYSEWMEGETLPGKVSQSEIQDAVKRVIENHRHFRVCQECGDRKPTGWMHNDRICQGCAEANYGIVY
jgi:hypothetical protein